MYYCLCKMNSFNRITYNARIFLETTLYTPLIKPDSITFVTFNALFQLYLTGPEDNFIFHLKFYLFKAIEGSLF